MKSGGRADLHIHTTVSDGVLDPPRAVREAAARGLSWISLCDHDAVADEASLRTSARPLGMRILPGVELGLYLSGEDSDLAATGSGVRLDDGEIHLLSYGANVADSSLGAMLATARSNRVARMKAMLHRLEDLGIRVGWRDVAAEMGGSGSPGRPHLAAALVERGYSKDFRDAFANLIAPGRPAYVPRSRIEVEEGIAAVISAGGVPVLAHPALYRQPLTLIDHLVDRGLVGVEVVHPDHSTAEMKCLLDHARRRALLPSGGSDFHGRNGVRLGEIFVPARWAEDILARSDHGPCD